MTIERIAEGGALTLVLTGRLDTTTAPRLDAALEVLDGVSALTLDFSALEYLSSAGLRVLLSAHKRMKGRMTVRNVNETIREVFEVTGFLDVLRIE